MWFVMGKRAWTMVANIYAENSLTAFEFPRTQSDFAKV